MTTGWMVDTIFASKAGASFEIDQLLDGLFIVEQFDFARVDAAEQGWCTGAFVYG